MGLEPILMNSLDVDILLYEKNSYVGGWNISTLTYFLILCKFVMSKILSSFPL
jgi:hypothetical protein